MGSGRRGSPWRWPVCSAAALTILLLLCFGVPSHWIKAFFSPLGSLREPDRKPVNVLQILPVPEIELVSPQPPAADRKRREDMVPESWRPDPHWWAAVWQVRLQEAGERGEDTAQADTVPAMPFWLSPTIAITNDAFTDTSRAHKLALYMLREREKFTAQKSFLLGKSRQRLYRELLNTTARLYDEFLYEEISVPDPDREYVQPRTKSSGNKLVDAR